FAVEHPGGAVTRRDGRNIGKIIARMPLGLGEGKGQAAVDDLRNEIGALLGGAAMAQKPAAEHHCREERFERQRTAEGLHRDHRLDRAPGRAAILLRERQPEQPEPGVLRPQLAAPALRALRVDLALLERVAVTDQAVEALLEKPLLLGQVKIHRLGSLSALTVMAELDQT